MKPARNRKCLCTGFSLVIIAQQQRRTPHAKAYPARRLEWF